MPAEEDATPRGPDGAPARAPAREDIIRPEPERRTP
jgi:hypothetical protein